MINSSDGQKTGNFAQKLHAKMRSYGNIPAEKGESKLKPLTSYWFSGWLSPKYLSHHITFSRNLSQKQHPSHKLSLVYIDCTPERKASMAIGHWPWNAHDLGIYLLPVKQFIAKTTFQVDVFCNRNALLFISFSRMIWFLDLSLPFKSQSSISPFYVIFHLFLLSLCGVELQSKNHKDFCVRKNQNVPMALSIEIPILMLTPFLMLTLQCNWRERWR